MMKLGYLHPRKKERMKIQSSLRTFNVTPGLPWTGGRRLHVSTSYTLKMEMHWSPKGVLILVVPENVCGTGGLGPSNFMATEVTASREGLQYPTIGHVDEYGIDRVRAAGWVTVIRPNIDDDPYI